MKAWFETGPIRLNLDETEDALKRRAARFLQIREEDISGFCLSRKSVDARRKEDVHFSCRVLVETEEGLTDPAYRYRETVSEKTVPGSKTLRGRPVVVGLGPCGLFAALVLARAGLKPLVLERGKPLEERTGDVEDLHLLHRLNPESNVCFGEGGAGAFSDGKLTTRIKGDKVSKVLKTFVDFGAPEEIRYEVKPHLGTENVRKIVSRIRSEIERLGGEVVFDARFTGLDKENGEIKRIRYEKGNQTFCEETGAVILALGHSARDTFAMLKESGIAMSPKAFAVGVRVEHERELIDSNQYGKFAGHKALGAADYKLSAKSGERGVYSFCMCPGGEVICSATEKGKSAVNGMSYYARDGQFSNSAIVVTVGEKDFPEGVLGGMEFQRAMEKAAFEAAPCYTAPAQAIKDYMSAKKSQAIPLNSYRGGTVSADFDALLPRAVGNGLKDGFTVFDRQIKGFIQNGVMLGVETRTSSPVRIERDEEGNSISLKGLYPAGEGAGYAGGIVSAAADGIRAAEAVLKTFNGWEWTQDEF